MALISRTFFLDNCILPASFNFIQSLIVLFVCTHATEFRFNLTIRWWACENRYWPVKLTYYCAGVYNSSKHPKKQVISSNKLSFSKDLRHSYNSSCSHSYYDNMDYKLVHYSPPLSATYLGILYHFIAKSDHKNKPPRRTAIWKEAHVQENSFGHAGRCLCINSYASPGVWLPWQSEVDEVPLLQLLHDKASRKVRWVQHPWWCHCRRICAVQAVQSVKKPPQRAARKNLYFNLKLFPKRVSIAIQDDPRRSFGYYLGQRWP